MLYHALRHNGSIGWLSVVAPDQDDERFFLSGGVAGGRSVVIPMVASTLTAVSTFDIHANLNAHLVDKITIELLSSAEMLFCPPGVHQRYLEVFSIMRTRVLEFLICILDGANAALDRAQTRDALRGLEDLLALLPVNE